MTKGAKIRIWSADMIFFHRTRKYVSFDNLLFTRVTKCVKGEEWENCRDFCLKNMLHHPMECDFRNIESIPHKSQNF